MAVAWLLRPFVLSLTALFAFFPLSNSITESESLLKFKQSLTGAASLDSWAPNSEPCGKNLPWSGLICNNNVVFGLQLERMGLSGNIDVDSLTGLPGLRTISIMNNSFTGGIPEFNRLSALKTIYLSGNRFSGVIPRDYFASMVSLKKVWLSNNEFSGPIPLSLATKLPNLMELHLENNKFDGPIPEFTQPTLVQVTVAESRHHSVKSGASRKGDTAESRQKATAAGELVMVNSEKGVFGLQDLMKAAAEVLCGHSSGRPSNASRPGSGGNVGSTYKAVMGNGVAVVVKRVTVMNQVSKDVFDEEVRKMGSLRHKNLLTPLGYHFRRDEKLLVSEFVPNLSLLHRLHDDHLDGFQLDWPARRKIIQGIARGMAYLHKELGFLILPHGNLKSSNVLLSANGEPLISEFGFHRLISRDAQFQSLVAYKSPEANRTGTVTAKSDVYCFGVVILEILTGKFPSQYAGLERAGGADVVEWVGSAAEHGGWMDLLHPTVSSAAAASSPAAEEIERILLIGVRCTGEYPDQRPEMSVVAAEITAGEEAKDDEFITVT